MSKSRPSPGPGHYHVTKYYCHASNHTLATTTILPNKTLPAALFLSSAFIFHFPLWQNVQEHLPVRIPLDIVQHRQQTTANLGQKGETGKSLNQLMQAQITPSCSLSRSAMATSSVLQTAKSRAWCWRSSGQTCPHPTLLVPPTPRRPWALNCPSSS